MDELPEFGTLIAAILAIVVAIEVGVPLAAARSKVVLPLVSKCPPLLLRDLTSPAFIDHVFRCGIGVSIFLLIPGTIGVGLLLWNSR